MIFKEITFSIAEKMGVYKNTTYFSDEVDDFLPIDFIRKSSNTINLVTKKIWYNVEKKSNRVEVDTFDAIRFDFGAIRFAAKALRFPFVGPRLQRDHRRNLREGFAFRFGAISGRSAACILRRYRQITQIKAYCADFRYHALRLVVCQEELGVNGKWPNCI